MTTAWRQRYGFHGARFACPTPDPIEDDDPPPRISIDHDDDDWQAFVHFEPGDIEPANMHSHSSVRAKARTARKWNPMDVGPLMPYDVALRRAEQARREQRYRDEHREWNRLEGERRWFERQLNEHQQRLGVLWPQQENSVRGIVLAELKRRRALGEFQ